MSVRVRCVVCAKESAGKAAAESGCWFPRRHKGEDGAECPGGERLAEVVQEEMPDESMPLFVSPDGESLVTFEEAIADLQTTGQPLTVGEPFPIPPPPPRWEYQTTFLVGAGPLFQTAANVQGGEGWELLWMTPAREMMQGEEQQSAWVDGFRAYWKRRVG